LPHSPLHASVDRRSAVHGRSGGGRWLMEKGWRFRVRRPFVFSETVALPTELPVSFLTERDSNPRPTVGTCACMVVAAETSEREYGRARTT